MHELGRAGFVDRGGKGSHRNFLHPSGVRVTLLGRTGDDAKRYQEQEVAQRIAAARSAKGGQT
jgi:predicted RNA binding protein YcfA (HicA-like mRNA interferase family)